VGAPLFFIFCEIYTIRSVRGVRNPKRSFFRRLFLVLQHVYSLSCSSFLCVESIIYVVFTAHEWSVIKACAC